MLLCPAAAVSASLEPVTLKAWDNYIQSATVRMEKRVNRGDAFLWVDEAPDRLKRVRAGEVIISSIGSQAPKRVPSGLIHDWVGAAFIPQTTTSDVLEVLNDYGHFKEFYQPLVVDSKVIASSESKDQFSMRLMNKSLFLKTAFDTEFESCSVRLDERRGYSVSHTIRVQEIEEYGTPVQRMLQEGEGSGIIWRLFSITRYLERDGGVYVEIEAIGLSRDIPASIRWLAEPIVRRASRGSLATSLQQTERAVLHQAQAANGKAIDETLQARRIGRRANR
jgi:hypothetical protein